MTIGFSLSNRPATASKFTKNNLPRLRDRACNHLAVSDQDTSEGVPIDKGREDEPVDTPEVRDKSLSRGSDISGPHYNLGTMIWK